jgi:hypothetical protein
VKEQQMANAFLATMNGLYVNISPRNLRLSILGMPVNSLSHVRQVLYAICNRLECNISRQPALSVALLRIAVHRYVRLSILASVDMLTATWGCQTPGSSRLWIKDTPDAGFGKDRLWCVVKRIELKAGA